MSLRIEELLLYPVKSCGSLSVPELRVGSAGPEVPLEPEGRAIGDRQWMLTDDEGKFLTQRSHPRMALIQPRIENSRFELRIDGTLFEIEAPSPGRNRRRVSVWGKEIDAAEVGGGISEAASEFLGKKVHFVEFDSQSNRESLLKGKGLGVQTRFTDSQQYLVVTRESLADLNAKLQTPIDLLRFRPNVILSGASAPYIEDQWLKLKTHHVTLDATKLCARCKIITVDPQTGRIPNPEPLVALSRYRKKESAVYFGHYFLSRSELQTLKVGDSMQAVL